MLRVDWRIREEFGLGGKGEKESFCGGWVVEEEGLEERTRACEVVPAGCDEAWDGSVDADRFLFTPAPSRRFARAGGSSNVPAYSRLIRGVMLVSSGVAAAAEGRPKSAPKRTRDRAACAVALWSVEAISLDLWRRLVDRLNRI